MNAVLPVYLRLNAAAEAEMAGKVIQGWFGAGGEQIPRQGLVLPARQPGTPAVPRPGPESPLLQHYKLNGPRHAAANGMALQAARCHPVNNVPGMAGVFQVEQVVLAKQGSGAPLPESIRRSAERMFGLDLSEVRVHVGPQPERIGAVAFTAGNDIYFAPGRYQPDSVAGRHVIGHELAHVMQQRHGRVRNPLGGVAVVVDQALEAEADRIGLQLSRREIVPAAPSVQRMAGHLRQTFASAYERIRDSVKDGKPLPGRPPPPFPAGRIMRPAAALQMATATAYGGAGTHGGHITQLNNYMNAVDNGNYEGGAFWQSLEAMHTASEEVVGTQDTKAIGYNALTRTFVFCGYTVDTVALFDNDKPPGTTVDRVTRGGYHAEMRLVQEGCHATYSTQNCCIFCYGYLEFHGIPHNPLRDGPFPNTGWRHPNDDFVLISSHSVMNVNVRITHNGGYRIFHFQ